MPANPWISSLADAFVNNALSALGAGVRAMENPGEFLRDDLPPGTDGLTSWIQDRNRRACRKHARNEAAGLYSDLGALRRPRYGHCRPYLDSINEGPEEDGSYAPPFSGGQCPGVLYQIYFRPLIPGTGGTRVAGYKYPFEYGPRGTYFYQPRLGPFTYAGQTGYSESTYPDGSKASITKYSIKQGEDTVIEWTVGSNIQMENSPTSPPPRLGYPASVIDIEFVAVGSSQDCGDPPNQYQPPRYPTGLPSLPPTTIAPPGGAGGDDIEVDPDGNWRFCENGDCTPWFTPGGGGTPADPGGEEDGDPQETNPNDPNNPNEISGCVEDGNVLVGLKINVLEYPITYDGSSDIYYRVGWIWMGPNEDQLDLTIDGATIRDGQFVFPDGPDCLCYTVRANPGFRLSVQAFSRPREENNSE